MPLTRQGHRRAAVALLAALLVCAALVAGCTAGPGPVPTSPGPTPGGSPSPTPSPQPLRPRVSVPDAAATVLDATTPSRMALQATGTLFDRAPVVVVASTDDLAGQLTGASAAVALGVPLLLVGEDVPDVSRALGRLRTQVVLAVGRAAMPAPETGPPGSSSASPSPSPALPSPGQEDGVRVVRVASGAGADELRRATGRSFGAPVEVSPGQESAAVRALVAGHGTPLVEEGAQTGPGDAAASEAVRPADAAGHPGDDQPADDARSPGAARAGAAAQALPPTRPARPPAGTVALSLGADPVAVAATIRAAGLDVLDVPDGDPRSTSACVEALAASDADHVVAVGAGFGPADRLAERVAAARTGVTLPGGGQLVFPPADGEGGGKRYVALYGSPGKPSLGVLGEQDVPATVARAAQTAEPYRALTPDTVVPAVEIIATVASAGDGPDGDYSAERSVDELRPLVEAAGAAGQYVVLDLQPGRTDFLTQARRYADLLALPYVGLALDPEWRLGPDQVHLRQIGSVGIDEVNSVVAWLADLVRDRALPQKMLVLHQFATRMITDRQRLDTSRDELALLVHVDGQGSQAAKVGTWATIRQDAPPVHWGWKNFYDEDVPMLDPVQTYQVQPTPDLVSYQ